MALEIAQQRRQLMTFALHQAVQILQMPQLELAQWLEEEIDNNPLLEHNNRSLFLVHDGEAVAAKPTLREHLFQQAREQFSDKKELHLAQHLIDQCDERGFINSTHVTPEQEKILDILQTFDPPGICARTLQESFMCQTESKSPLLKRLIRDHFQDLLSGRFSLIRKKLRCSREKLRELLDTVSQLSPRPAASFESFSPVPLIPDLTLKKIEQEWVIEIGEEELPLIQLRSDVSPILSHAMPEEKETVRGWIHRARWLQRALLRRRKLLLEIGKMLGESHCQPTSLSINELAKKLEIHPSTAWRLVAHKSVAIPSGIKPLRDFFSHRKPVQELLQRLIDQEDKAHPFTDEELTRKLKEQGFSYARRTISALRRRMKLRSSIQRML